jgi:hypothetical protein
MLEALLEAALGGFEDLLAEKFEIIDSDFSRFSIGSGFLDLLLVRIEFCTWEKSLFLGVEGLEISISNIGLKVMTFVGLAGCGEWFS